MTDPDETAAHYKDSSKLAVRGGFHARFAGRSWFGWFDERLGLTPGSRVLDVGCGPGWFWAACQRLPEDLELNLLDQSAHMIEQAIGRLSHLRIGQAVVADAMHLPFPNASFDTVVAMHMLYHLPDPAVALREMHRVLVSGGRCIVSTNSPRNLPQISDLSRVAFGSAIDDVVQARFGTAIALDLMKAQFSDVSQQTYADVYEVDDPEPVIDMLLTMPPGDKADAAGRQRLQDAVADLFTVNDGLVRMQSVQDMIVGTRAA
ncbi:class I SAM-dependent methyltransferase [Yoonia sp. 2307UL14-13]|uniref:class I SAM-dependent methyltransferase n=1 Tax=Yoonia sp. 2307UL14-13 TaxID=3126506 RepID=UPI0030A6C7CD